MWKFVLCCFVVLVDLERVVLLLCIDLERAVFPLQNYISDLYEINQKYNFVVEIFNHFKNVNCMKIIFFFFFCFIIQLRSGCLEALINPLSASVALI